MRILWHSAAPWAQTGYGQQTALFAPRIRDLGHDIALSATWGLDGAALEWEGMHVYPADGTYGKLTLDSYAAHHGAELVLTLLDTFVLVVERLANLRMASWCPVDHWPAPPRVHEFFVRTASRPIAMSRFGEAQLRDIGLDPLYVPHGVDCQVFAPQPDRLALRERFGIPRDAFVVGLVAANIGAHPPRKAFPQVFQAFAAFRRERPDAFLYVHSDILGRSNGINLAALAEICGLPRASVGFADQLGLHVGIPPRDMVAAYAAFDVLVNPSYGEGFGIPIVEAQACGTPVIVSDWTSMPELCGAGWRVGGDAWYDCAQGAFYGCPSVLEITAALLAAYDHASGLRDQAREFALAYDAERVLAEYWIPALEELARPREAPPLNGQPNRAQRRAQAKRKQRAKAAA